MARTDWQYVDGSTNNNSVFFTGIRWKYRDDLFGQTGYPSSRISSNTDIIEYQPYIGRKQNYSSYSYTSWKSSKYRYSYNTTSGSDPAAAANELGISTTFRFDKASNNTKYYPVTGALSAGNVFNTSSSTLSRIIQVPHCSDGTSKLRLYFYVGGDNNTSFHYGETNQIVTLDTIPRASTISVDSGGTIGSPVTIRIGKADDSFTTAIGYRISGSGSSFTPIATTGDRTYTWTPPTSLYNDMSTTQKTITLQFQAITSNSSSVTVGDPQYCEQTFNTVANISIGTKTATDINSVTAQLTTHSNTSTTRMVKGYSNVKVEVSATAGNHAAIKKITVDGVSLALSGDDSSTTRSGNTTFNNRTTKSFTIIVTDSRDKTKTETVEISTLVEYTPLTLNCSVARNTPVDGRINISCSGSYWKNNFGYADNTLSLSYQWREQNGSWNGSWITIPTTIGSGTGTVSYNGSTYITGMDYTKIFEFKILAADKIFTNGPAGQPTSKTVSKGTPVYWWDNDEFDTNVTTRIGGNLYGKGALFSNNKTSANDGVAGVETGAGYLELSHSTPYIDFHYNNSTADYTSRIIETSSGKLQITGKLGVADDFQTKRKFLYSLDAGGGLNGRFYKLVNIPASDDANAIQVNIRGFIGNWTGAKATIDIQISNRNGLNVWGTILGNITALDNQRIVIQQESNNTHTVYLYCASSFVGPNTFEISWGKSGGASNVTIYTDYSYTTSPSGTQVWNTGTSSSLNPNIVSLNGTISGTTVVTRTSGATLNSSSYRRYGNVVQLTIIVTSSGTTNAGSNCFVGQISDSNLIPKISINSSSYNSTTGINGYLDATGKITLRVLSASLSSGKEITIGFTYVI